MHPITPPCPEGLDPASQPASFQHRSRSTGFTLLAAICLYSGREAHSYLLSSGTSPTLGAASSGILLLTYPCLHPHPPFGVINPQLVTPGPPFPRLYRGAYST